LNSQDLYELHRNNSGEHGMSALCSERARKLEYLWRVYHGRQYDVMPFPFNQETRGETYIPLRDRRPSVRYNLAKIIVKKTTAMMFSGRHWPQVTTDDQTFTDWLDSFYDAFNFSAFSTRVATYGSIGSVVPVFRIGKSTPGAEQKVRLTLDVWHARDCCPHFNDDGDLEEVMLKYLSDAETLRIMGMDPGPNESPTSKWWYRRRLTRMQDITYRPTAQGEREDKALIAIPERTYDHNLNIVPALWVRNLPTEDDNSVDGTSTFGDAIDFFIEIDYQLSQCGRGLKYNADPELAVKEPLGRADGSGPNTTYTRSASSVLELAKDGDAKLLEMTGNGQKIAIEFVEKLRNFALEVMRGSRKDPQRALSHAQSGKLAEMLEDDLIGLGTELRASYGRAYLIPFTQKILAALKANGMGGQIVENLTPELASSIRLEWGPWFEPTSTDHVQMQQALREAVQQGTLDLDTATRITYHSLGLTVPKTITFEQKLAVIEQLGIAQNKWQMIMSAQQQAQRAGAGEGEGGSPTPALDIELAEPKPPQVEPETPTEDLYEIEGF
jgi:hypothetical protein